MHRCVASLTQEGSGSLGPTYAEALLGLVGGLVASTSGCSALSEAGLIPAFLPILRDTKPEHVSLVGFLLADQLTSCPSNEFAEQLQLSAFLTPKGCSVQVSSTVRIMEAYMDFSPSATTLFRDLGGLREMIQRLQLEVGVHSEIQQSAGSQGASMDTQAKQEATPPPAAEASTSEPKPIAYSRRVLLKALLRAIAQASYTPGSGARPQVWPALLDAQPRMCA